MINISFYSDINFLGIETFSQELRMIIRGIITYTVYRKDYNLNLED